MSEMSNQDVQICFEIKEGEIVFINVHINIYKKEFKYI